MKNAKSNVYHLTGQRSAVKSVKVDIRGLFRETSNFDKLLTCENIWHSLAFRHMAENVDSKVLSKLSRLQAVI
jgi:hypothetical protein